MRITSWSRSLPGKKNCSNSSPATFTENRHLSIEDSMEDRPIEDNINHWALVYESAIFSSQGGSVYLVE